MAIQFANEMYGEYTTQDTVEQGWPKARAFFMQGANAVLKEIEEIIAVGCDDTAFSNLLKGKIEQLKK